MELERQTLTKDFGIGTHAGGLFLNGTLEDEPSTSSENSKVVYQFTNWVGSNSASELATMQSEDPDIGLLLNGNCSLKTDHVKIRLKLKVQQCVLWGYNGRNLLFKMECYLENGYR